MAYYHRTKKDLGLTVVDAKDIEKLIVKSMMEDNRAGLLDITAVAASGDEDKGEEERDQDEEHDEDVEVEDEDRGREEGNTFQDGGEVVKFPKVAMWYRNAIIDKCWNEATPSQKDAVDKRKMQGTNTKMAASADDDDKVTRLDEIILFVTSYIRHHNFWNSLSLQHVAVAQVLNVSFLTCLIKSSNKRAWWELSVWLVQTLREEGS